MSSRARCKPCSRTFPLRSRCSGTGRIPRFPCRCRSRSFSVPGGAVLAARSSTPVPRRRRRRAVSVRRIPRRQCAVSCRSGAWLWSSPPRCSVRTRSFPVRRTARMDYVPARRQCQGTGRARRQRRQSFFSWSSSSHGRVRASR